MPEQEAPSRPCVYCGRSVPQRGAAGRPFRYCRDNDGDCQRKARNGRMRERNSPGLAGQVARSWELVERLELTAATLADSLHAELTPAGVERQVAHVRAEAAGHVAGAHTERDEARREAEAARGDAAGLRDQLTTAAERLAAAAAERDNALAQATQAGEAVQAALRERDEARNVAAGESALRARAHTELAELTARTQREIADTRAAADARGEAFAGERDAALAAAEQARQEREVGRRELLTARAAHAEALDARHAAEAVARETGRAAEQAGWTRDNALAEAARWREQAERAVEEVARAQAETARAAQQTAVRAAQLEAAQQALADARTRIDQLTGQLTAVTAALTAQLPVQPAPEPVNAG